MISKKIIFYLVLIFSIKTFSQTGPGGVGANDGTSDLIIWYRSDNGIAVTGSNVDTWVNSAGYTPHNLVYQGSGTQPTLTSTSVNGYDEVRFYNSGFLYTTASNLTTSNFVTNAASSFITTNIVSTTRSNTYGTYPININRFNAHIPWNNNSFYFDIGQCCGAASRINLDQPAAGYFNYSVWSYEANAATGKQAYRNGSLLISSPGTSTFNRHALSRFQIGHNFNGNISEVVIFKSKVNTAQRLIIQNYLSAKFNITLTANDFYTQDDSGSGNFDHKVAGIGQATDGTNQTDSKGTGIVRINAPSDLTNNEYLFWGEDVLNANYNFSAVTAPSKRHRIDTKWRVSERGDVGTVNFSLNASDINLTGIPAGVLKLVRSTTSDFSSIVQEYDLTLTGGVYSATVPFDDNDYFTLETVSISDLSLTKTVDKAIPKVGETVIFTLTLTNSGPQDATGVLVRDLLPTGLAYNVSLSTIASGTYNATTGDWDLSGVTIANGSSVSIQIAATVNASGVILNTSEVISLDQEDPDATPNNSN